MVRNYPNPFTGTTNIELSISETCDVRAEVFDMTGKLVRTLYKGRMVQGVHTLKFDANGLQKGLYIGKISAGSKQHMLKMIVR